MTTAANTTPAPTANCPNCHGSGTIVSISRYIDADLCTQRLPDGQQAASICWYRRPNIIISAALRPHELMVTSRSSTTIRQGAPHGRMPPTPSLPKTSLPSTPPLISQTPSSPRLKPPGHITYRPDLWMVDQLLLSTLDTWETSVVTLGPKMWPKQRLDTADALRTSAATGLLRSVVSKMAPRIASMTASCPLPYDRSTGDR